MNHAGRLAVVVELPPQCKAAPQLVLAALGQVCRPASHLWANLNDFSRRSTTQHCTTHGPPRLTTACHTSSRY